MRLLLGEYPVCEIKGATISLELAPNQHMHVHALTLGFAFDVKVGDKLPLYTEIPLAKPQ